MNQFKLIFASALVVPSAVHALTLGHPPQSEVTLSPTSYSTYSSSSILFPSCAVDYANLASAQIQRVGFYVTNDVLNYASKEDVRSWIQDQIDYSNEGLRNSCVDFQQEIAVVRYVETPNNQPDASDNFTYSTEELTAELYQKIIAGLDVDDLRGGTTTPMGRTSSMIKNDWTNLSIDRVINVRPYYRPSGYIGSICGVGYGFWMRPNKAVPDYMDAPFNSWGEATPSGNIFATLVYPNDSICSSDDLVAHELGHTNGLSHERESGPENNHADTLGFAYQCDGEKSIMWSGANNTRQAPFFSSPDVTNNGVPCGDTLTSYGNDSSETLNYMLGTSSKHTAPRAVPYQGVVDSGDSSAVGDTTTWNTITNMRHSNMDVYGEVSFSSTPASVTEGNGTFSIDLDRTDTTYEANVTVRVYGDGNVAAGHDIEFEKTASFSISQASSTVVFNKYDSGLFRQNGSFTVKLETPFQVELGSTAEATVVYVAAKSGNSGKVSITANQYSCKTTCDGVVTLSRSGGSDGEVTVDVVYRLNGTEVERDTIIFNDGDTYAESTVTHGSVSMLTIDLEASHPSLVQYSRSTFSNYDDGEDGGENPDTPSTGGGGGGALGWLALIGLLVFGWQRNK